MYMYSMHVKMRMYTHASMYKIHMYAFTMQRTNVHNDKV